MMDIMKTKKKHKKDMKCHLYFSVLWVAYVSAMAPRIYIIINKMLSACMCLFIEKVVRNAMLRHDV